MNEERSAVVTYLEGVAARANKDIEGIAPDDPRAGERRSRLTFVVGVLGGVIEHIARGDHLRGAPPPPRNADAVVDDMVARSIEANDLLADIARTLDTIRVQLSRGGR